MSWSGVVRKLAFPTSKRVFERILATQSANKCAQRYNSTTPENNDAEESVEELREKCRQAVATAETLTEEVNDIRNKYRRALAETENVRRRGQKLTEESKTFAIQSFCKDLCEVADVLDLAVESFDKKEVNSNSTLKSVYDGVVMTKKVLHQVFNKHGLSVVTPEGEKFDPNNHEAVFQVPAKDSKFDPGHVHQVLKVGYSLHGRPIRAAQVAVVQS
ncbi:GrpE protein-like protein [Aphelenchoides besseyi]|nr:GrpE protein-like protein [Aphelenchoides besseyi]KAI6201165.1 GrpE protein-like protein [Aphelenchoides besseyi]